MHILDKPIVKGIINIKKLLRQVKDINIFRLNSKEAQYPNQFIIDYQNEVLSRQNEREEKIRLKRENLRDRTIYNQMMFEKNLKPFYKRLERIKSESIIKKSKEQRRKIFRDLKRAEAEERKREEEERLLNQKIG